MTYVVHYTSADRPEPNTTWSVYREEYADITDEEPIDGTQVWISAHLTEAEADAEASRLQREHNFPPN